MSEKRYWDDDPVPIGPPQWLMVLVVGGMVLYFLVKAFC